MNIAIIDSGVNPRHSHVGGSVDGLSLHVNTDGEVRERSDFSDSIGHGTAIAGIIRKRAPDVSILAIRIFHETLSAPLSLLTAALQRAIEPNTRIIHLSLGTVVDESVEPLMELCQKAIRHNLVIVAAARNPQDRVYPSTFDSVIGVCQDKKCDESNIVRYAHSPIEFGAYGYSRELPGVPKEFNFRGGSFAAAQVTGRVARLLADNPTFDTWKVKERLSVSSTKVRVVN